MWNVCCSAVCLMLWILTSKLNGMRQQKNVIVSYWWLTCKHVLNVALNCYETACMSASVFSTLIEVIIFLLISASQFLYPEWGQSQQQCAPLNNMNIITLHCEMFAAVSSAWAWFTLDIAFNLTAIVTYTEIFWVWKMLQIFWNPPQSTAWHTLRQAGRMWNSFGRLSWLQDSLELVFLFIHHLNPGMRVQWRPQ